jgi:type VI secretion system protein ImpJ
MKGRKLVWTEGLFMTQHHFQQLDRYHEALVTDRLRAVVSYDWGVAELAIDERALAAGQVRIASLVAVLPDGTPILAGDRREDRIPSRAIDATVFPANVQAIDVHIGLYDERENAPNVALEPRPDATIRYEREQIAVFDFNGGGEQALQVARRNVRVLLGEESREGLVTIRVARIERMPGGSFQLSRTFIPPSTRVSASPILMAGFRQLLGTMVSKQRMLAGGRKARTEAAVDFEAGDNVKFWLLHTLNEQIPRFSHVIDHGHTNPELAYLTLASLIGQLCTFAVDGDPTQVPSFQYLDLASTFDPMFKRAQALLGAVVAERFVEISLQKREDGLYLGQFDDPALLQYEFFVSAEGVPEAQLRDRLAKLTKVASWNQITSILNSAVNGCKLDLEYRPPGALPVRPGLVFYRLSRTPDFWNDVVTTASIAIYQPMNHDVVQLKLYAVDPKNLK